MSACEYMDDDDCPGTGDHHQPHNALADLDRPRTWQDGDEVRDGHACVACGHIVAAYPHHTDPRLDVAA